MMYEYEIPFLPSSLNEFMGRNNEWEYRAQKREWEQLVCVYCRPRPSKPIDRAIVTLTFHFKTKARHDPDNYIGGAKPLMDGLVRSGIIKDDSFSCIELVAREGEKDKNGRIDILIEEVENHRG